MTGQSQAAQQVPYNKVKLKRQKKTISFKIYLLLYFQAILLNFLGNVPYVVGKKRYLCI